MALEYSLVHWLASGVVTTAGAAVASGKVRFYDPGTLTPHSVYSDTAGTSAITQPITLSAGGRATVYTNAVLRCIIKDSTDTTTLFDTDINSTRAEQVTYRSDNFGGDTDFTLAQAYEAWSTSGAGGVNTPWAYRYSATANERTLKSWMSEVHVSVKDFGAVGDGVANDTTAIQSTITAVGAAGGGVVYFPPGTYLVNTSLTLSPSAGGGVSFEGTGQLSSVIKGSGGAISIFGFTTAGVGSYYIRNLGFSHSTSSTAPAIVLAAPDNISIENLQIAGHRMGVDIGDSGSVMGTVRIRGLDITTDANAAARAIRISTSGSGAGRGSYIEGCDLNCSAGSAIELAGTIGGISIFGGNKISGAIGLNVNTVTGNSISVAGNDFSGSTDAISVTGTEPIGFKQDANGIDGYEVNVAIGGNHTPDLTRGNVIRIVANSGGAGTVTVNAPTPTQGATQIGKRLTIKYTNASGGAVTWAFAAATFTHVGAAVPANTDAHTITVEYIWDGGPGRWREVTRGDTVT